jgi:cytochrome c oxidase subunit III
MSTIEAAGHGTQGHDDHGHDGHGHGDHDHPSFLAHHFDTPEQQFDSGKLGIWLFLVTEVLFFSGMFCAYAIFRMTRPDVFEGCSQFLNTKLGAINTGVLLFSSLTMAWAVRCAQTEEHKKLTALLACTLSCAMVFLGVKTIEYSHKWGMGLLPAGYFTYNPANPHPEGGTNWLLYLCTPFALLLIGVVTWLVVSIVKGNKFHTACAKLLTVVCFTFFAGVGLGMILESGETPHVEHAEHAAVAHDATVDAHHGETGAEGHAGVEPAVQETVSVVDRLAKDATNTGIQNELLARKAQMELSGGAVVVSDSEISGAIESVPQEVMTPSRAGVFFGIYYCMTGVHAIHIIGGIVVLVWLLIRSVRQDFNRQYFGPVDYVGLYWHIVDLIWIYLFPLLYLIR